MAIHSIKTKSKIPLLFLFGAIALILFGIVIQLYVANTALDLHLHDTYLIIPHFHMILFISFFFGTYASIYYVFPKVFRRYMNEALGLIHFIITFLGTIIIFIPVRCERFAVMPRRYYDYSALESFKAFSQLNYFISIVVLIVFLGQILFVWNFIASIFIGKRSALS